MTEQLTFTRAVLRLKVSPIQTNLVNGDPEKDSHPSGHWLSPGPYVSAFNACLWALQLASVGCMASPLGQSAGLM